MFVRDTGDGWQVVMQTDHADLSGDAAEAWADRSPRHDSLVIAARRHDDGWAVWEQSPLVDEAGAPVNFLSVQVPAHLAFYRANIASVGDEDAYAGLLVSMHGCGIYRQRYGLDPGMKLAHQDEVRDLVDAFVAEEEGLVPGRMAATGVDEALRWKDYERLQFFDRFAIHFSWKDVSEPGEIQGHRVEPIGGSRYRMDPFPFVESPARFSLLLRKFPKRPRTHREFQADVAARPAERTEILIER
jgi:hypothetical protein